MDKVDVAAVQPGVELMKCVQLALLCLPIKFAGPIIKQLPKVFKVSPLLPSSAWCLIRPACLTNALSEVRQDLCLDVNRERSDMQGGFHCRSYRLASIVTNGLTRIRLQAAIYFCLHRGSLQENMARGQPRFRGKPRPKNSVKNYMSAKVGWAV